MSKKIGRNDPCPCGSGKKYKHCHLNAGASKTDNSNITLQQFYNHDKFDLLKTIAALQLIPLNHGKNIRFEILARNTLLKSKANNVALPFKDVSSFFKNNYTEHYLEDPMSSFFTENVIFYGGNYTVFPGLNGSGTIVLNLYLETVFTLENNLPEEFKKSVYDGATLILLLSESMAVNANLKRYEYEEDDASEIRVSHERYLCRLKQAVSFKKEFIERISQYYNFNANVIDEFLIAIKDKELQNEDPDKNPLLTKPILQHDDEYIFTLPTVVTHCLIEFIVRKGEEYSCLSKLRSYYDQHQWGRVEKLLHEINWDKTTIELPAVDSNIHEGVFRFDNDKLAYVRLIANNSNRGEVEIDEPEDEHQFTHDARTKEVISYLEDLNGADKYSYFVMYVTGEYNSDFFFLYGDVGKDIYTISLQFNELEKLVYTDELDALSLWKFMRAYSNLNKETRLMAMDGILGAYVTYIKYNESFYLGDDVNPTHIHFGIGTSSDFERGVIKQRDEHAVLQYTNLMNGALMPVPVKRFRKYAPIYVERDERSEHNIVIKCFNCPLWTMNSQAKANADKYIINIFSEAIIFWLYKMRESLSEFFSEFKEFDPVQINIVLDEGWFKIEQINNDAKAEFVVRISNEQINLEIPHDTASMFFGPENNGEKILMTTILRGLNQLKSTKNGSIFLTEVDIEDLVNHNLSPSTAKMILFYDSSNEITLDNRWLVPLRGIQESDINMVLDNLVSDLNLSEPIPSRIETTKEKNDLSNKIVGSLIGKLTAKLKEFDAIALIKWLVSLHETCVYNREFRELQIPAKIGSYSDYPTEIEKFRKEDLKLVNASISLRCLIEFVVASPESGSKKINLDDIDQLLALMNLIINYGMQSDAIDLGMDDPEMGLLPSGRIGIDKSFYEKYLKPFSQVKRENLINNYVEDFTDKLGDVSAEKPTKKDDTEEIDEALLQEFNITLTNLMKLSGALIQLVISRNNSIIEIGEQELMDEMVQRLDLTNEEIANGLCYLSLNKRKSLSEVPKGYDKGDIYPWRYNRALSYLRKPLIRIKKNNEEHFYYFGFRHVWSTAIHLKQLILSGRLQAKEGGFLNKFLSKINSEKGDFFRNAVAQWLSSDGSLKVIPYEVKINNINGHLISEKDYGDIDILVIDEINKIIYLIECKNTVSARSIHEMKSEMDKYLGRNGTDGMIVKHVERDAWAGKNKDKFSQFVPNPEDYKIVSLVLTSEEIPLTYLAKEKLPLPFISFILLKRKGIEVLQRIASKAEAK